MTDFKYGFTFGKNKRTAMRGLYPIFNDSVSRILQDLKDHRTTIQQAKYYKFTSIRIEENIISHKRFMSLMVSNMDQNSAHEEHVIAYCILHTIETNGEILSMDAQNREETVIENIDAVTLDSEKRLINYGVNANYTDCIDCAPYDIPYVKKQEKLNKREQNWLDEMNKRYQKELSRFKALN